MIVTTLTKDGLDAFRTLAPGDMLEEVEAGRAFAVGVVQQEDVPDGAYGEMDEYAAGILLFRLRSEEETGEPEAELLWLYVAEEYRKQGVGDALMEEFYRILDEAEVEGICCDVPAGEEYLPLAAFLEDWNLTFTLTDKYELTFMLADILQHPVFLQDRERTEICSLKDLPSYLWKDGVRRFLTVQDDTLPEDLSVHREDYDQEVSCAWVEKDSVAGLFLIRRRASGLLELRLLRVGSGRMQEKVFSLLSFAVHAAEDQYTDQVPVYVECRTAVVAALIDYFFPDSEAVLVRRGRYTAPEEEGEQI